MLIATVNRSSQPDFTVIAMPCSYKRFHDISVKNITAGTLEHSFAV